MMFICKIIFQENLWRTKGTVTPDKIENTGERKERERERTVNTCGIKP